MRRSQVRVARRAIARNASAQKPSTSLRKPPAASQPMNASPAGEQASAIADHDHSARARNHTTNPTTGTYIATWRANRIHSVAGPGGVTASSTSPNSPRRTNSPA